jgi:hypothetical protein
MIMLISQLITCRIDMIMAGLRLPPGQTGRNGQACGRCAGREPINPARFLRLAPGAGRATCDIHRKTRLEPKNPFTVSGLPSRQAALAAGGTREHLASAPNPRISAYRARLAPRAPARWLRPPRETPSLAAVPRRHAKLRSPRARLAARRARQARLSRRKRPMSSAYRGERLTRAGASRCHRPGSRTGPTPATRTAASSTTGRATTSARPQAAGAALASGAPTSSARRTGG